VTTTCHAIGLACHRFPSNCLVHYHNYSVPHFINTLSTRHILIFLLNFTTRVTLILLDALFMASAIYWPGKPRHQPNRPYCAASVWGRCEEARGPFVVGRRDAIGVTVTPTGAGTGTASRTETGRPGRCSVSRLRAACGTAVRVRVRRQPPQCRMETDGRECMVGLAWAAVGHIKVLSCSFLPACPPGAACSTAPPVVTLYSYPFCVRETARWE
jgi:hypothetical protein